jgi:hypothetical protein
MSERDKRGFRLLGVLSTYSVFQNDDMGAIRSTDDGRRSRDGGQMRVPANFQCSVPAVGSLHRRSSLSMGDRTITVTRAERLVL